MSLDIFQEINGKLFPISSFCFTVNKMYEKWDMLPAGGVYIYKAESFFLVHAQWLRSILHTKHCDGGASSFAKRRSAIWNSGQTDS